jgi:hypothetical protein
MERERLEGIDPSLWPPTGHNRCRASFAARIPMARRSSARRISAHGQPR